MRGFAAVFAVNWRPVFTLPVDQMLGHKAGVGFHAFPPNIAVVG